MTDSRKTENLWKNPAIIGSQKDATRRKGEISNLHSFVLCFFILATICFDIFVIVRGFPEISGKLTAFFAVNIVQTIVAIYVIIQTDDVWKTVI